MKTFTTTSQLQPQLATSTAFPEPHYLSADSHFAGTSLESTTWYNFSPWPIMLLVHQIWTKLGVKAALPFQHRRMGPTEVTFLA